jgi:hypothetical protein
MRFPALLQLARVLSAPLSISGVPSGSLVYQVFGCIQSRGANFEATPQPAMHRFAVMNADVVDEDVLQILDAARALGALSTVKLIAVRKASLYLFLDAKVSSSKFAAIESLWLSLLAVGANQRWAVRFASESEIFTGRSDYDFWPAARKILESEALGHTPHTSFLSNIEARLGHRGAKTIDRYLHTFEAIFNFYEANTSQMTGRCLPEPERYPTELNLWPHTECFTCGYALMGLGSKFSVKPM